MLGVRLSGLTVFQAFQGCLDRLVLPPLFQVILSCLSVLSLPSPSAWTYLMHGNMMNMRNMSGELCDGVGVNTPDLDSRYRYLSR